MDRESKPLAHLRADCEEKPTVKQEKATPAEQRAAQICLQLMRRHVTGADYTGRRQIDWQKVSEDLVMEVSRRLERIAELEAELERERARAEEEREQCCRDLCVSCRSGWMPERSREWDGLWSHGCSPCAAQAIHERHYQAQRAERKEGE